MKNIILFLLLFYFYNYSSAQTHIGEKKLYFGVAYYPETWPESAIDLDIQRMKELNVNVVRMAEFSWSKMEPQEGQFQFGWLHKIIEKLHANGIDVVLGTPTATPPVWMWEKYPEIARVDDAGLSTIHGARRSTNFNSKVYRNKSVQIVEKMAKEFGQKAGVIAWQTDNEFHPSQDFSPITHEKWHQWLKDKYGSIENLNQIWATDLWSQTYQDFSQIPMPLDRIWHHTSLRYEWKLFNSFVVDDYQDLQLEAIRKYSDLPITHDGMPGQDMDYTQLMDDLDFMAVNNYHSFEAYDRVISNYDRMRGYNKGFHWLFETAPNYSGGGKEGKTWFLHQPDNSLFAAIWMNYALGGQGTMFWLWRQHRAGQEMVHGSFVSAWNEPAANYEDLKKLGEQLKNNSSFLINNPVAPAKIAIVYDHKADMGLEIEHYANDIKYYNDWTYRFYLPFHDAYLHRDVISQKNDIEQYKILFLPLLPVIEPQFREKLQQWVMNGGTLILGPMSGYRSQYYTAFTDHALGDLANWTGIEVASRIPIGTSQRAAEIPVFLNWKDLRMPEHEASLWSEALRSSNGKILAQYTNGMHKDLPAIVENKVGKGKVVQLGTDPGRAVLSQLFTHYAAENNVSPLVSGDPGVLVVPRQGKAAGLILVNITNQEKRISLPKSGKDLLSEEITSQEILLQPYQVMVIQISNQ